MAATFQCPHCEGKFPFTPQLAGKPARCARCGAEFTAPAAFVVSSKKNRSGNIHVICTQCHAAIEADPSWSGRQSPCPRCGTPFTVPERSQDLPMVSDEEGLLEVEVLPDEPPTASLPVAEVFPTATPAEPAPFPEAPQPAGIPVEGTIPIARHDSSPRSLAEKIAVDCRSCGAHFKVPPKFAGKPGKCTKCGAVFTIPEPSAVSEELGLASLAAAEQTAPTVEVEPQPVAEFVPTPAEAMPLPDQPGTFHPKPPPGPTRSFWADSIMSWALGGKPGNIGLFVVVVILTIIAKVVSYGGCLTFVAWLFIQGWLCAFYLNLILETASGDDDFPSITLTEGFWEGIIKPLLLWILVSIVCWGPAVGWMIFSMVSAGLGAANPANVVLLVILWIVGIFIWPMVMLIVGIGRNPGYLRPDLVFKSIFKTFVPYLFCCLMLTGAIVLKLVQGGIFGQFGFMKQMVFSIFLVPVIDAYLWVVAMRSIGLLYRHYKKRLAWVLE